MSLFKNLRVIESLRVGGNLDVKGTTTSINTRNLNVEDANVYINKNMISGSKTGGVAINTNVVFQADVQSVSGLDVTVNTGEGASFSTGDIVQLSNLNEHADDGLYVVAAPPAGDVVTLGAQLTAPFDIAQTTISATQTVVQGELSHITLSLYSQDQNGVITTSYGTTDAELQANMTTLATTGRGLITTVVGDVNLAATVSNDLYRTYVVDSNAASRTVTLPATTAAEDGHRITIIRKDTSAGADGRTVTINTSVADGFDGDSGTTSLTLDEDCAKVTLIYGDGGDRDTWYLE